MEINAANTSGIWSKHSKTIRIIITSPWWRTWVAYLIYLSVIIGLVYGYFYYRYKRIQLANQIILKQNEAAKLKEVDEMKSRFFSNITHEFRTPLSLIISPIEKLQKDVKDQSIKRTLAGVLRNAEELMDLINQLLDLSKLETGSMTLSYSKVNAAEFIRHVADLFKPLAEYKNIMLQTDLVFSNELIFDADKLKTVISNLLSNAIKFTPGGGKVVVNAKEDNHWMLLTVSDTGIGVSEQNLPYIFDRFYQADNSLTRSFSGSGIGLSLVRELMELMGGKVSIDSKLNAGTIFTIRLPVIKADQREHPFWHENRNSENILFYNPGEKPNTVIKLKKQRELVLIVEDNKELSAFLEESVGRIYDVITAHDGLSGLTLAKERLPDIIISDVMMPGMDGYELCSQIKKDTVTSHIAIILLTAKVAHESRMHGLNLGADDYVNKPFHVDELESRIFNLLNHREKLKMFYLAQLKGKQIEPEQNKVEDEFIKSVYTILAEHIDDGELDVPKLAAKMFVSQRTLNRKLNMVLGLNANEVVRQFRLTKALALLRTGSNVTEAAYKVGFESPAYFSQCFKEQYGVSPKEYSSIL